MSAGRHGQAKIHGAVVDLTNVGVALLYDFDYQAHPDCKHALGPLQFIGTFPFVRSSTAEEFEPKPTRKVETPGSWDQLF